MEKVIRYVVDTGVLDLNDDEKERYKTSQWDSFACHFGHEIINGKVKNQECQIVFFPVGKNNLKNLEIKQNIKYQGESLISPLFYIEYNKNQSFKFCKRKEENIPNSMHYMIIV